jgi:hypothetical protein
VAFQFNYILNSELLEKYGSTNRLLRREDPSCDIYTPCMQEVKIFMWQILFNFSELIPGCKGVFLIPLLQMVEACSVLRLWYDFNAELKLRSIIRT